MNGTNECVNKKFNMFIDSLLYNSLNSPPDLLGTNGMFKNASSFSRNLEE